MAATLAISAFTLTFTLNGLTQNVPISRAALTLAGNTAGEGLISVPTADTTLAGLPTTPGVVLLVNLDAVNYIQAGPDATNWFHKLSAAILPYALFPLNGAAIHVKANGGACLLFYKVFPV